MKEPLYVWAEEGGIELKLSQPHDRMIVVEIVTRGTDEKVYGKATMASFRWKRIADYFTPARDEERAE